MIRNKNIDAGRAFDWGRTSENYAKYRDIYPKQFYEKIVERGLCVQGQKVLDLGTGTGVLPRNMYHYGATWIGTDIAENQILQARRLADEMGQQIRFDAIPTEEITFPTNCFDVITACQCFWYFDFERVTSNLMRMLKPDGTLLILYMAWLPFEDPIAGASEELVLKYNPKWSGAGETRKPIGIPDIVLESFVLVEHEEYDLQIPFTRESWNGRMKACRGVGASLPEGEIAKWEAEHLKMLAAQAPNEFTILHYAALAILKPKKSCGS